jgi:diphosphoinositol-polyphosphate diphosphatase
MCTQGGWETDETVEAAAKRETIEEAGVRGVLEVWTIGRPPHASKCFWMLHNHPRCHCTVDSSFLNPMWYPQEPMLGVFSYSSAKASRLALSSKPRGMAHMFVMHVAEELQKWPEADRRTRLWVSTKLSCPCVSSHTGTREQ